MKADELAIAADLCEQNGFYDVAAFLRADFYYTDYGGVSVFAVPKDVDWDTLAKEYVDGAEYPNRQGFIEFMATKLDKIDAAMLDPSFIFDHIDGMGEGESSESSTSSESSASSSTGDFY